MFVNQTKDMKGMHDINKKYVQLQIKLSCNNDDTLNAVQCYSYTVTI